MSTTDTSGKIKTVVVLVMENRSFDHMLGWMKTVNQEIDGVSGDRQFSNPISTADPGHTIQAIYEQVYGVPFVDAVSTPITPPDVAAPPMNGFAQEAEGKQLGMSETVMNGFLPAAVALYEALVREFAVCDRWFASVPGPTQPNRAFVHSATSNGLTSNDNDRLFEGLPQRTIFDNLYDADFSFGIYCQFLPLTLVLSLFHPYLINKLCTLLPRIILACYF